LTVHFERQFLKYQVSDAEPGGGRPHTESGHHSISECQVFDAEPGEDLVSYQAMTLFFSQAFDAGSGEDQIPYRVVTLFFSQAFNAGSGEDQIPYRAVTLFFRVSGFSMPSLVKTRSRIEP
jgi:hypothetical protein